MDLQPISLRDSPCPVSFIGCGDLRGTDFSKDSRSIRRGDIFVAVRGNAIDGHDFLNEVAASGAAAVIVERPFPNLQLAQCVVKDTRQVWAWIAMRRLGNPARHLQISGVTGTNGKTTVTWMLRAILRQAGFRTGLVGTIEYSDGQHTHPSGMTTPDAVDLATLFRQMVSMKTSHCVMEISSHALDQQRCSAFQLAAAALTNITQDHFDYHGDFDSYLQCKVRIAELLASGVPLFVGIDDPGVRHALRFLKDVRIRTFGMSFDSDLKVSIVQADTAGQTLEMSLAGTSLSLRSPLIGRHNALNLLTAAGMAWQLGVDREVIRQGLEALESVPGRMERIEQGQPFLVVVDYAHTSDGLTHAIAAARALASGKITVVFGAGGDRDRNKRPLMAQAAETADAVIVTSDNPRSEAPQSIIADICSGFSGQTDVRRITDREQAIRTAFSVSKPDDVVLIAGRGHETLQTIGTRQISFDDRKVARRLLRELGFSSEFPSGRNSVRPAPPKS